MFERREGGSIVAGPIHHNLRIVTLDSWSSWRLPLHSTVCSRVWSTSGHVKRKCARRKGRIDQQGTEEQTKYLNKRNYRTNVKCNWELLLLITTAEARVKNTRLFSPNLTHCDPPNALQKILMDIVKNWPGYSHSQKNSSSYCLFSNLGFAQPRRTL